MEGREDRKEEKEETISTRRGSGVGSVGRNMSDSEANPNLSLYHAIELLVGDTKQRLSALEIIKGHVDTHALERDELNALADSAVSLLKDNNFKVCIGALRVTTVVLGQAGDHAKVLAPILVPALIERLGDGKAAVRSSALDAIFVLIDGLRSPNVVHERFAGCWTHKNSHIRESILKISAYCFKHYGTKYVTSNKRAVLIKDIVHLLGDSSSSVRETAMSCIEAAYSVMGNALRNTLKDYGLRSAHMKEINSRLDQIQAPSSKRSEGPAQVESPTNKSSTSKRGGFGDGGGVTNDGSITNVEPIHLKSSHDLQNALEDIKEALMDTTEKWQSRMDYMMKLEGIILGNGKKYDLLPQMLNHMKTCFIEQVLDRRSAVSRQACHLLTLLSEHMGSAADNIVEHLVPILFKVVVISVQVQADAAHCAVKRMMRACHVGKLVTQISKNLQSSRNAKLRCACIDYFHVVLESWLKPEYHHYISDFEVGLKSALSDASKDVRARARETFVMFKSEWPENAGILFESLSSSVQKAIAQTGKKKTATRSARQSIRSQQLKSTFAAQLVDSEADGDQNNSVFWPKKEQYSQEEVPKRASSGGESNPFSKRSSTGGAKRVSTDPAKEDAIKAARVKGESRRSTSPRSSESAHIKRKSNGFSFKAYLDSISTQNLSWNVKVEKNGNFRDWILKQGQSIVSEIASDIEKLVFVFVDHFNDPHHKVALSSLVLFETVLPLCLHMLEPYVEKFCPPLFLKMVDSKEQVRMTASEILMTIGERYSVETLIPALSRSLRTNKHPRSRIATLEFSVKYFKRNTVTSSNVLEGWISLIGPLICEKVVEVRRAAAAALVRVYQSVDAEPVLAYILSLAPRDQTVVRKVVHSFVGSIDEELAAYAQSQNIYNLCWLDKAAEDKEEEVRNVGNEAHGDDLTGTRERNVTAPEIVRNEDAMPQRAANYDTFLKKSGHQELEDHSDNGNYKGKGSRSPFALREKPHNMEIPKSGGEVEMHDLELILGNLGKCNLQQDYALKQFSTLARKYPSSVWEVFCDDTVSKLLTYMQSGVPGVKACALLSVKEFACHQAELVSRSLGDIISLVLEAVNEAHLEVKQSADECLMSFAQCNNVEYFVELLLDHLSSFKEDTRRNGALVSVYRALGKALGSLPFPQLNSRLGEILPHLFASFNSPDADVRKAVVFCLVDIYSGMGNMLMPHLSPLSTAQLKLLTIYIQRSKRTIYGASNGKENSAPGLSQPTYV